MSRMISAWLGTGLLCFHLGGGTALAEAAPEVETVWEQPVASETYLEDSCKIRRPFESDHAFDGFVGPISNPIFSKDPRTLTEARLLFINNWIDNNHPAFGGGDFQVYAMQVRVALTERLSLIADKDGYAVINPDGADEQDGWLNVAAGLKYLLIRDVENQFLLSAGFMYELQRVNRKFSRATAMGL